MGNTGELESSILYSLMEARQSPGNLSTIYLESEDEYERRTQEILRTLKSYREAGTEIYVANHFCSNQGGVRASAAQSPVSRLHADVSRTANGVTDSSLYSSTERSREITYRVERRMEKLRSEESAIQNSAMQSSVHTHLKAAKESQSPTVGLVGGGLEESDLVGVSFSHNTFGYGGAKPKGEPVADGGLVQGDLPISRAASSPPQGRTTSPLLNRSRLDLELQDVIHMSGRGDDSTGRAHIPPRVVALWRSERMELMDLRERVLFLEKALNVEKEHVATWKESFMQASATLQKKEGLLLRSDEDWKIITSLKERHSLREKELDVEKELMYQREKELEKCKRGLLEQERSFQKEGSVLAERERLLEERAARAAEREKELDKILDKICEREKETDARNARLLDRERNFENEKTSFAERESEVEVRASRVAVRERELDTEIELICDKERDVEGKFARVSEMERELEAEAAKLCSRERILESKWELLAQKEEELEKEKHCLHEREREINAAVHWLKAQETELDRERSSWDRERVEWEQLKDVEVREKAKEQEEKERDRMSREMRDGAIKTLAMTVEEKGDELEQERREVARLANALSRVQATLVDTQGKLQELQIRYNALQSETASVSFKNDVSSEELSEMHDRNAILNRQLAVSKREASAAQERALLARNVLAREILPELNYLVDASQELETSMQSMKAREMRNWSPEKPSGSSARGKEHTESERRQRTDDDDLDEWVRRQEAHTSQAEALLHQYEQRSLLSQTAATASEFATTTQQHELMNELLQAEDQLYSLAHALEQLKDQKNINGSPSRFSGHQSGLDVQHLHPFPESSFAQSLLSFNAHSQADCDDGGGRLVGGVHAVSAAVGALVDKMRRQLLEETQELRTSTARLQKSEIVKTDRSNKVKKEGRNSNEDEGTMCGSCSRRIERVSDLESLVRKFQMRVRRLQAECNQLRSESKLRDVDANVKSYELGRLRRSMHVGRHYESNNVAKTSLKKIEDSLRHTSEESDSDSD